jgi:hypothetical protein
MKRIRPDLALRRILDALEGELLAAPAEEIQAAVAETGLSTKALLAEGGDAEHRRVGGMARSFYYDRKGDDSTPHPDLRSNLPLKGGDA